MNAETSLKSYSQCCPLSDTYIALNPRRSVSVFEKKIVKNNNIYHVDVNGKNSSDDVIFNLHYESSTHKYRFESRNFNDRFLCIVHGFRGVPHDVFNTF